VSVQLVAIVDRQPDSLPPALRAVGAGPHLLVEDGARGSPSADELLARHALLAGLAREVACLPCRFGDTVPSESDALAWLAERQEVVVSSLARVAGNCEFDLRLRPAAAPDVEDPGLRPLGPGLRHLRTLAARYAAVNDALLWTVAERARNWLPLTVELDVDLAGGLVAFLVSLEDAAAFADAARALRIGGDLPEGMQTRWSGPWPAYTFAKIWLGAAP
jgi:hypothetical protein